MQVCVLSEISTTTGFEKPEICYLVYREALGRATSRHYTVRLQLHLLAFLSDLHPLFIFTLSSDWLSSWSQNGDQQQPEWRQASLWMASWRGEIDFLPLWNETPFPSSVCSNLVTCLSQPTTNITRHIPSARGLLRTPLKHESSFPWITWAMERVDT